MAVPALPTLGVIKEMLLGWAWPPAVTLAKTTVLAIFSGLDTGILAIKDEVHGTEHAFGRGPVDEGGSQFQTRAVSLLPRVEIAVKRDSFWLRLFLLADIGFAESYMLGDFECNDLTSFFQLFIANRDKLNNGTTIPSTISSVLARLRHTTNSIATSQVNTAAHYDISNEMFAAFLSEDMTYSCPIWQHTCSGGSLDGKESLEHAQQRKLLRFIQGAKIKATDHVLEIGTGWGSFAIEAVKRTGCRVTSITLSRNQKELAEERIKSAGLDHRIEVEIMDYREIPMGERFDKVVSIEMIEAVGEAHLEEYFAIIDRLLKRDWGIAMFQCITIPDDLHSASAKKRGFIDQYIFPGGYLPSTTEILNHISQQSCGTLNVERVENIGGHYIKALRLWRENFLLNFNDKIRPALLRSHPEMTKNAVEIFRRKWEYYFSYCEAGFLTKTLNDVIITVSREGATELIEGIPL